MPKHKPDRDDSRGGLGQGGPQDGPIGAGEQAQQGAGGSGRQRHEGGSSRDSEQLR